MDGGFCLLQYTTIMICRKVEKVLLKVRESFCCTIFLQKREFSVAFQREKVAVLGEKNREFYLLFLCSKEEKCCWFCSIYWLLQLYRK